MPATSVDTIVAIATPPGIGGIGIVRLSGPEAFAIGARITGHSIEPGKILFRKFLDAQGEAIDHGLCLGFIAPHSFSGEDCLELQAHGGPIVLDMLCERVCELGARLAQAGEFSERAFLNGRIDLTQAEAIADLIESGSRAASRAAMRSLEGRFSEQIQAVVDELIDLRAYIEVALDFAEEEIDFLDDTSLQQRLQACANRVRDILIQAEQGRTLQEGLNISLAGLPNAGKSSLLNTLAGYDAAIVTDVAGTTRDVLREHISLKGVPLRINDTAGLRDSDNPVEQEGVRRAWAEMDVADLVLFLVDSSVGLTSADRQIIDRLPTERLQTVYSKADLLDNTMDRKTGAYYVSAHTGEGIEELIERIVGRSEDYNQDGQVIMARRRHVDALHRAQAQIDQSAEILRNHCSGELVAEELRGAQQHLSEITGEFSSEDLLGAIFGKFCIGK